MMQVTIELPEEIAAELTSANGANLPRAILEMVALEGYRSEKLTHAEVGRLLGMDHPLQVEAFLEEHGVPLDYTLERGLAQIGLAELGLGRYAAAREAFQQLRSGLAAGACARGGGAGA